MVASFPNIPHLHLCVLHILLRGGVLLVVELVGLRLSWWDR